ncbi:single-stranded-DNA-specific exonuclease RecJ [Oscillospiraceae bacterium MB08-C2-2]|nr:single-stranded-DNA-specific exonuclease RecJ [Oscillospiraceae bacterium MB08-C2-2]
MGIREWIMRPTVSEADLRLLQEETQLPELVCRLLAARGCTSKQALSALLQETTALESPFALADMEAGVARVARALENGERIAVYGDYDCDGITATALMVSYLQNEGADVIYYLPNREKEGYGLNRPALDILAQQGVELIITVDNGISALEEIEYAATLGMEVVVTDHHQPRSQLPQAVAVINPHRKDCPSRYKDLAGVGVAFKLICGLEGDESGELMEYYADLVALGTIADVVPLTGDNRILVRHGLRQLADPHHPGIIALLEVSGLSGRALASESVAFGLIPRLNATGRMGVADDGVELLLTESENAAMDIAGEINEQNLCRKETEEQILKGIFELLQKEPHRLRSRILSVWGEGWHHGVVGIVASRLMERYGKPVMVFSLDAETARGSCRSLPGFSIIEAISACSGLLSKFGGHNQAAGLSLPREHLEAFTKEIEEYAARSCPVMPVRQLLIDAAIEPSLLQVEAVERLSLLEPFGSGNEQPVFLLRGAVLEGVYSLAEGRHIRLKLLLEGQSLFAVYFGMTPERFPFVIGDKLDAAANINTDVWNGTTRLSIRIKDVHPSGLDQQALLAGKGIYESFLRREITTREERIRLIPSREDLAAVYRYMRKIGKITSGVWGLYYALYPQLEYCSLCLCVDILSQAGLLRLEAAGSSVTITAEKTSEKADLDQTPTLKMLKA